MLSRQRRRLAFTIVELMVVVAIIALLAGLLFSALLGVRRTVLKTNSMSNMRQIHLWMRLYSDDNNGTVLPSQFDYNTLPHKGRVRTVDPNRPELTLSQGDEHAGTWTDILWTENELGLSHDFLAIRDTAAGDLGFSYIYDSPDETLYEFLDGNVPSVLRSAMSNTRNARPDDNSPIGLGGTQELIARPFGRGAQEQGLPGFFAANNIFNVHGVAGFCWTNSAQLRVPDRTMYIIDSLAGEIIDPEPYAYQYQAGATASKQGDKVLKDLPLTNEVDFRYNGTCLMLLLDGHISTASPWRDLADLQNNLRINVTHPFSVTPYKP